MVFEITYQTKKDVADPHCHVRHIEYFESSSVPDRSIVAAQVSYMHRDVAEGTISISENKNQDAAAMRRSGLRITRL
jgi:hypothetical protein